MLKSILRWATSRKYSYIDLVVLSIFTALICYNRWWEGFFALMAGTLISSLLEHTAAHMKP